MPILLSDTKKEYAIMLTHKCTWNCQYCAVKNKIDYAVDVSENAILNKLNIIDNNSIVTLYGGEPGLVSRKLIEKYLSILNLKHCEIYLETNGEFIKNFPDLILNFKEVLLHCSEDLNPPYKINQYNYAHIRYLIIVHDFNISRLQIFLKINNDIKFDIIEATYPCEEEMKKMPTLSKLNKNMILAKFGNRMTKDSFKRLINGKDFNKIIFLD